MTFVPSNVSGTPLCNVENQRSLGAIASTTVHLHVWKPRPRKVGDGRPRVSSRWLARQDLGRAPDPGLCSLIGWELIGQWVLFGAPFEKHYWTFQVFGTFKCQDSTNKIERRDYSKRGATSLPKTLGFGLVGAGPGGSAAGAPPRPAAAPAAVSRVWTAGQRSVRHVGVPCPRGGTGRETI